MKNYITPFVFSAFIFAGLACSHKSAQQITPDRVFMEVTHGAVKKVSPIYGVREDSTACLIRDGAMFTADGIICNDIAGPWIKCDEGGIWYDDLECGNPYYYYNPPVRDSLGRVIEFYSNNYSYLAQELRPVFCWYSSFMEHNIYNGNSLSPSDLYIVNRVDTDKGTSMEVWRKQYKYIENDSQGNWIRRKSTVTIVELSGEAMEYYAPLCDLGLPLENRIKLENELCLEVENKSNKNIEITSDFVEIETREVEYYE